MRFPAPEFDAWRWNEYWVPLELVIEFKRDVYQMALSELARFLPRVNHHNRYLRSGMRTRQHDDDEGSDPRYSEAGHTDHGTLQQSESDTLSPGLGQSPGPDH